VPSRWELLDINNWPLVYFFAMGLVGAVFAYILRGRGWAYPASKVVGVGLVVGTVVLHLLAMAILHVDPRRDSGNIPLPYPLPTLAYALVAVVYAPGLLWQGYLFGSVVGQSRRARVDVAWHLVFLVVGVYSVWMFPWSMGVIFD
jgi:hypothetical protein